MITTIQLHGEMARLFGRTWKLDVKNPAEALRAIEANKPGLISYLGGAEERGIRFRIRVGGEVVPDAQHLDFASRGKRITISPVVCGAKSKWAGVIIGVALVAFTWGASAGYFGSAIAEFASSAAFGINGLTYGAMIGGMGIGMAVGGIAQMLTPTPKVHQDPGTKSYAFNGPANVSAQGGPVPLCYGGPIVVGSIRISAGIKSEDRPGTTFASESQTGTAGEGPFTRAPNYASA